MTQSTNLNEQTSMLIEIPNARPTTCTTGRSKEERESHSLLKCAGNFFCMAVPMKFSNVFMQLVLLANIVLAGRIFDDPVKLAGIGLAAMILKFTIFWPLVGMNGALETLVAHAYGAGDLRICVNYLNRSRMINTVITIPLIFLVYSSRKLLAEVGTDERVLD